MHEVEVKIHVESTLPCIIGDEDERSSINDVYELHLKQSSEYEVT